MQLEFRWDDSAPRPAPDRAEPAPRPANTPAESAKVAVREAAAVLRGELERRSGLTIALRITNNASTMMSIRYTPCGTQARLSLHHMFLDAPATVRTALVKWIVQRRAKRASETLNRFIQERADRIQPRAPKRRRITTRGHHHDLAALFEEVNREHFDGAVDCPITWGKRPSKPARRSIRFGSYSCDEHLIRIHPYLDQAFVPRFFVRYIVFHEMLHAHLGVKTLPSGRRAVHPPAFKKIERAYPDYKRAVAWMDDRDNLARLLGRRGRV